MLQRLYRSLLLAAFLSEALAPALLAQAAGYAQEEGGPGRGVARLSLLNGDVTVRRGDSGDLVAAAVNAPLLADDRVLSGQNSRAEIQLDYYDRIRLASDTEVRFSELDWNRYQVQLARGTTIFSALPGTNTQIEFATPAGSLRPLAPGSYRMTVYDDGSVDFTVRRGEADIYTPQGSRRLAAGRTMRLHLGPDNVPEFQIAYEPQRDWFDDFSDHRDQEVQRAKSYQYVSRDIQGAEDLDGAGEWVDQPPYGMSWRPYVAADWAPYREGRWVWADDDYGWTWVSYDPWGWAPYHYGRWFCNAGAWYWYPGPFGYHHYWSPGLVAFFGYGGFGVGFGYGGFGWVPLAPFETYHPWYGRRGWGGGHTNIVNNVNIYNTYRNARVHNGVSGMNARDFGQGSGARSRAVSPRELTNTSLMHGALPVSPSRNSLRMSDRPVSNTMMARANRTSAERFVASRPAPASSRTAFGSRGESLQAAVRGNGGGDRQPGQGGWTRAPRDSSSTQGRTPGGSSRGGWSSFGTPSRGRGSAAETSPAQRTPNGSASTQRGGWTSFGSPDRGQGNRNSTWSTGGGTNGGYNRNQPAERRSPGSTSGGWTSSAPQQNRGGWSTGGGSYSRGEAPSRSPAYGDGGWSSRTPQQSRGGWSTGGSTYDRGSSPYRSAPSNDGWSSRAPQQNRGGWNTGGSTYDRGTSPYRSAPSNGGWGSRAPQQDRGGWGSRGGSSPSYSAPYRGSAPSYSAPSRSSGPSYSAPSRSSAPHYSAPSGGGGGGGRSSSPAPSRSGGGGGRSPHR